MVGATESAPRELGSPRRAGLRCMLMSIERSCVPVVDSRDDPVTDWEEQFLLKMRCRIMTYDFNIEKAMVSGRTGPDTRHVPS
jgi:hypothetical protein